MAGFQQAANALTGAIGTVGGRVGVYNELVGKNKEQREQLAKQNEELEKKNKELEKKNKELEKKDKTINFQKDSMAVGDELLTHYMKGSMNLYMRNMEHERAQESKKAMLKKLYGKPTEEESKEFPEIPFFKKEKEGGK